MRGLDERSGSLFSYVDLDVRVRRDHPLRPIREIANAALSDLSEAFAALYRPGLGRPSIPPERLLRAQLLQIFYSIRSERLLMEQLDYNLLFRWFVGMDMDEATRGRIASRTAPNRGWRILGHLLIENRHGLIAAAMAATVMVHAQWQRAPWRRRRSRSTSRDGLRRAQRSARNRETTRP